MTRLILIILFLISSDNLFATDLDLETRIECGITASLKHDIPADILLAISSIENGEYDIAYKNSDGSIDYGIMQINSSYIKDLKQNYKISVNTKELLEPTCYSFDIASFKVAEHLKNDKGSFMERVANYHSRTRDLNRYYQTLLIKHSSEWRKIFQSRQYIIYLWDFNK